MRACIERFFGSLLVVAMVMATAAMGQWHPDVHVRHRDTHQSPPVHATVAYAARAVASPAMAGASGGCCACSELQPAALPEPDDDPAPLKVAATRLPPVGPAYSPPEAPPRS